MNSANMQILTLSATYVERTNKRETTVATYAAGQAYAFQRLRDGKGLTFARFDKIVQWFSDNWAADLAWPNSVERPAPAVDSPAGTAQAAQAIYEPPTWLNSQQEIANPNRLCDLLHTTKDNYYQAIKQYADDKAKSSRMPRRDSALYFLVAALTLVGDVRFSSRREEITMAATFYAPLTRLQNTLGLTTQESRYVNY